MGSSAQNSSCTGAGAGEGSGEGSGEGRGGFGAEPGQAQQQIPVKVWEALVQSQVRFNRRFW